MDFSNPENIKYLRNLLNPKQNEDSDSDIDAEPQHSTKNREANRAKSEYKNPYERLPESEPKTFEEWEQRQSLLAESFYDDKKQPKYRIIYKQSVSPEDIYLGIGNRTPATSSCEEMCIEIDLPEETVSIDKMVLNVSSDCVDLETPVYRFRQPLVQKIDPDRGNASWDNEKKILKLTLRTKRELDIVNF